MSTSSGMQPAGPTETTTLLKSPLQWPQIAHSLPSVDPKNAGPTSDSDGVNSAAIEPP